MKIYYDNTIKNLITLLAFILFSFLLINSVQGECNLYTNNKTQTSIEWNLTEVLLNDSYINNAYLDGNSISNTNHNLDIYSPVIISNNLQCNTNHILKVYSNNSICNLTAQTLPCNIPQNNQDIFFGFINQYILILLILGVYAIALSGEPLIAFIGLVISFIGLTTTINYTFTFGSIFVILIIVGFFIATKDLGD